MSLPLVLLSGAALRLALPTLFPQITTVLAATAEVSTPIDSFRSLKEAFFYLDHGIDVYDGAIVHHPPLFVTLMKLLNDALPPPYNDFLFTALYTALDVGIAYKLTQLNAWYNQHHSRKTGRTFEGASAGLVAAFYLFNPLLVLTNWAHSTAVFTYFLVVELLVQAVVDKNIYRGAMALGVASYLSFNPIYMIAPYLALAYAVAPVRDWETQIVKTFVIFFFSVTSLLLVSFALYPLIDFLYLCYWSVILFEKITPNLGLWWYIFTEMFEFFSLLYKGIFNLYNFVFVVPFTLRFFEYASDKRTGDSFFAFALCFLWISFSKSYPIIGDLGFSISLFPIFKNTVIPHAKFLSITTLMLITCLLLSPIFYYCWIVLGNGNSNFFYSMSLAWGVIHVLLFLDLIWGRLTFEYIETNNVENVEKLRLSQI
ncbi:PIG-U-domain-containing protein [Metschnikowia bicuspidata var. bicuspidata NRRL YB-4993]|uniref:PIG-U-domain-containing protein n=1 Tax=Metschnikowia bicuspidata var. bicuspidata NRRL YB-4993 TaxID=869754 RepID=A0A1A0H6F2_9ASCO|nr:PIG-U-domain-containing protein [Metschnikowia bicuspidata var. bicuspidata NRRL YB-4993]OBA19540.1 PIG-U-domain-containing protein [Metschnikowia bicuspidata var. bicuspidata NRRL YB-4993]